MLPKLLRLCCKAERINLPKLMMLKLRDIPCFTSIYPSENKFEASCLLIEGIVVPELETLYIANMENLKEIWPREFSTSKKVMLRKIDISHWGGEKEEEEKEKEKEKEDGDGDGDGEEEEDEDEDEDGEAEEEELPLLLIKWSFLKQVVFLGAYANTLER
ncbi:hypothetical protein L2E82_36434 [Cichorium intybus]|uniref:Uncharacterized protein n=1 Tax=Cichorium intybus TaxID=13427 RepID=A0ACB9BRP8_CICIN|nr:hypothetical protein L2E82_36434 [Cichorium intybus]